MSDDLVKMLCRAGGLADYHGWGSDTIYYRAADHIETQSARIAELEAALNQAKQHFVADEPLAAFIEICAALGGGEDE